TLVTDKDMAQQVQDGAAAAARNSALDAARHVVGRLPGNAAQALPGTLAAAPRAPAPELLVDQHFEPLRRLAGGAPGGAPVDALLARVGDFYQELSTLDSSLGGAGVQMTGLASAARLKAEAAGLPPP